MTTLNTITEEENIEEKIDTICRQADQYQINAGYPVGIPAKTIILSLFTSAMQRAYEVGFKESLVKVRDIIENTDLKVMDREINSDVVKFYKNAVNETKQVLLKALEDIK